jgi:hypothetical protein
MRLDAWFGLDFWLTDELTKICTIVLKQQTTIAQRASLLKDRTFQSIAPLCQMVRQVAFN